MAQDYDDQFKTPDLALAAALSVSDYPVASLDYSNPRRVVFVFDYSDNLTEAVARYWAGSLSVEPKGYFDALKHLKTRIYSA